VITLEEIEQIYIRSEEHSAREKGRLLERIEKLEAACREALEAAELCGELDEELLREALAYKLRRPHLHKDFVERYKKKADSSVDLPYAYPTDDNA
jgi:phage shock protein A